MRDPQHAQANEDRQAIVERVCEVVARIPDDYLREFLPVLAAHASPPRLRVVGMGCCDVEDDRSGEDRNRLVETVCDLIPQIDSDYLMAFLPVLARYERAAQPLRVVMGS